MLPKIVSLISIVALMGWMFYFLCGGLPLLILKHDVPQDARFVHRFFDVHYVALMSIAAIGVLGAAFSERVLLAAAIGSIGLVGFMARRVIVSAMDRLRGTMSGTDTRAIRRFRQLHGAGLAIDAVLLFGFVVVLSVSTAEIVNCIDVPPGCRGDACRVQCSLL